MKIDNLLKLFSRKIIEYKWVYESRGRISNPKLQFIVKEHNKKFNDNLSYGFTFTGNRVIYNK